MRAALPAIRANINSLSIFECYLEIVDHFCKYLHEEVGIRARALPTCQIEMVKNRFLALDDLKKVEKLENFKRYYNDCRDLTLSGVSLSQKRVCLMRFLAKYGLRVPDCDDALEMIDKDTFIEIYDNNFTQIYRSADFLNVTGHGLMALETCEWFDLFERSKDLTADQLEVVTKIFNGSIQYPVYKPIEDHYVREINSDEPRTSKAEIVLYSPVYGDFDGFLGVLHMFRIKEQRSLNFSIV